MLRIAALLTFLLTCQTSHAQDKGQDARRPGRFAIIFNKGYGGDTLPKDPGEYERLVAATKKANFNVIWGAYDPTRAEILKKHDMQIFVDLTSPPHHVYKQPAECQKLLKTLQGDKLVYGYHLWSDTIGETYAGRTRDVRNVHEWDPTHPAYVGTYKMSRVSRVEDFDLFGYYDFHWKRGGHWQNLTGAHNLALARKTPFLRYDDAAPGLVGKGNPQRVGYTMATSIVFGLRGYAFHYAGGIIDKAGELDALGKDVQLVNGRIAAMGDEIMKLGISSAIYSTPVTRSAKNDPLDKPGIPGGIKEVPKDLWVQVAKGEVLFGTHTDTMKRDVLILASHNAHQSQETHLKFPQGVKSAEIFDRPTRAWKALEVRDGGVQFTTEEAVPELVRVTRQ